MALTITNVTAGRGGAVYLLIGEEKTAVHDTGMAYCAHGTVENIKRTLAGRPLDYVFLSHTHYDHAGGLPYLRQEWRQLVALGAAYGQNVLTKPGALHVIRQMAVKANREYNPAHIKEDMDYRDEDLRIDRVVREGERISLGGETEVLVLETPGHTRCSLSYYLPHEKVMFPCESSGVITNYGIIKPNILTGYQDALNSIEKCSRYPAARIISPHYGDIDPEDVQNYWDWARKGAAECLEIVGGMLREGATEEDIISELIKRFRVGLSVTDQPLEAFIMNAKATISVMKREMEA